MRLTNPYCEAIDPPAYFPDVMDHIVPPTQLLAQIITNQYTFRAAHQNIILTRFISPGAAVTPKLCSQWWAVL